MDKILAEYQCEDLLLTVEIVEAEDGVAIIESGKFPLQWLRHNGWCNVPRRAVKISELRNIRRITDEGVSYANLVHSAYGEALEDDPQRDAETQAQDVEKFGWYDIPEIKDGLSSPAWFKAQPEIEF